MPIKLDDLVPSYQRFFQSFIAVKICPRRIDAPEETLSFNTLTLAIAIAIFVIARSTTGADTDGLGPQIVAMVISALISFVAGYVVLIFVPTAEGLALSKKWATFFVHVWLASLIALIAIDGIAIWNKHKPPTSLLIDAVFVPASLSELQKDAIRAAIFTVIALALLLIKTKRQDPEFKLSCRCWVFAAVLSLVVNCALLLAFVYGNLL